MIYLDNAATTFPKPNSVYEEVERCMRNYCGNPGRSGHQMSLEAARKIYECRESVAELFHTSSPELVAFTYNATYALNLAIKGLAHSGDHILISNLEHNSVIRPVYALGRRGVSYGIYNAASGEDELIRDLREKLRPNTKMIVATHTSNVVPITLPIKRIGELCARHGIIFIVDASQSAGIVDINLNECNITALCAPGHKGLYGPMGSGFIIFSDRATKAEINTLIEGGSGIDSFEREMPHLPPERFEAGTLATPAIAGLCAGIKAIRRIGISEIAEHEERLRRRLYYMLANTRGFTLYGPSDTRGCTVLFNADGIGSTELSDELDRRGVCVRSGFHCSPLAHDVLGTGDGGAVRVSFSIFNTEKEVDSLYTQLKNICKA